MRFLKLSILPTRHRAGAIQGEVALVIRVLGVAFILGRAGVVILALGEVYILGPAAVYILAQAVACTQVLVVGSTLDRVAAFIQGRAAASIRALQVPTVTMGRGVPALLVS